MDIEGKKSSLKTDGDDDQEEDDDYMSNDFLSKMQVKLLFS